MIRIGNNKFLLFHMAKSGMNPKTLQYLMGYAEIGTTMNVYTHVNFDDEKDEIRKLSIV